MVNENGNDQHFVLEVTVRAREKVKEIAELLHKQSQLEVEMARAEEYLEQLNTFLQAGGRVPTLFAGSRPMSAPGTPGTANGY